MIPHYDPARTAALNTAFLKGCPLPDGRKVVSRWTEGPLDKPHFVFTLDDGSVEGLLQPIEGTVMRQACSSCGLTMDESHLLASVKGANPAQFIPPLPAAHELRLHRGDLSGRFTADQANDHARAAVSLVLDAFAKLLPADCRYMDPPDGGSPSVLEQVRRMAEDADKWRKACAQDVELVPRATSRLLGDQLRELDTVINGVPTGATLPQLVERLRAQQPVQILNLADGMRVNFQAPDGRRSTLHLRLVLNLLEGHPDTIEPGVLPTARDAIAAYPVAGEPLPGQKPSDEYLKRSAREQFERGN